MRLRTLALIISAASLALAEHVAALGLGEIKLNSALNEPLDAEIRLLQVRDLTEEEILIGLASNADFDRVGVQKTFFLTGLKFNVDLEAPSGPVVKITSRSPVREPYLNFLIESQWPSGRILREYTLLMDLPVFSAQTESPVQAPAPSQQTEAPASTPAQSSPVARQPVQPSRPSSSPRASAPSFSGDTYGPVDASDTLWDIALKVRPSRSYSVQQTMIAIQRLNPEAFIDNNINLLRRGQVLRVPSSDQIAELNQSQAVSEVAFQNNQWDKTTGSKPALIAGSDAPEAAGPQTSGGRVSLGVDDISDRSGSSSSRGSEGQTSAALQNELAITLEQLDSSKRENTELKSRVAELEEQIETMERLVEVSSTELRALQLAAEQAKNAEGQTTGAESEVPGDEAMVEPEMADAEAEQPIDSELTGDSLGTEAEAPADQDTTEAQAEAEQTEQEQAQQPATRPDPRSVVTTAPPKEPSFIDTIMENIVLVAAVFIALLVAAFLLVRKLTSKNKSEEEAEETFNPFEDDGNDNDASPMDLDDDLFNAELDQDLEPLPDDVDESVEPEEDPEEDLSGIVPEEVIAEADIYIAYGKYDQAESMLKKAIKVEPDNNDARVKLLEVFAESGDLDKFDQCFTDIHASGDNSAIARGDRLRSQFADAAPFAAAAVAGGVAASALADSDITPSESTRGLDEDFDSLDFDSLADELDEPESQASAPEPEALEEPEAELSLDDLEPNFDALEGSSDAESDDDFDFDLDPDFDLDADALDTDALDTDSDDEETDISLDSDFAEDLGELDTDSAEDADELDITAEHEISLDDNLLDEELSLDDLSDADESSVLEGDDEITLSFDLDESDSDPQTDELSSVDSTGDGFSLDLDDDLTLDLDDGKPADTEDGELSLSLEDDESESLLDLADEAPDLATEAETSSDESGLLDLDLSDDLVAEEEGNLLAGEPVDDEGLDLPELSDSDLDLEPTTDGEVAVSSDAGAEEGDDDLAAMDDLTITGDELDESMFADIDSDLEFADLGLDDADSDSDDQQASSAAPSLDLDDDLGDDLSLDIAESELSLDEDFDYPVEQQSGGGESTGDLEDELEISTQSYDNSLSQSDDGIPELTDEDDLDLSLDLDPPSLTDDDLSGDLGESDAAVLNELEMDDDAPAGSEDAGLDLEELDKEMDALASDVGLDDMPTAVEQEPVPSLDDTLSSEAVFEEVLASSENDFEDNDNLEDSDDNLDGDMDFLADTDESDTKLDLARAYIDMGDGDGARDILGEVLLDGSDEQKAEAQSLMEKIGG